MPKATITQILSPSSVRIHPPWAYGNEKGDTVRLKGIAGPELELPEVGTPGYAWRKQLAESWFHKRARAMVGKNIYYEGESIDSDGQLIANVWVDVSGILIPEDWGA